MWVWIGKMDVHRTLMRGHEIEPASGGEKEVCIPRSCCKAFLKGNTPPVIEVGFVWGTCQNV